MFLIISHILNRELSYKLFADSSTIIYSDCHDITEILLKVALNTIKKSFKIPKGKSESVYRRRTDNTMANVKHTNSSTL